MTAPLIAMTVGLAVALAALGALRFNRRRRPRAAVTAPRRRRVLFPFMADALSPSVLDAALRLAIAEDATLVPVFLARVPMHLPLEAPLPHQSSCLPLQEAIEHRATEAGVPVDSRIERGRSYRHALRRAIAHERFNWVVIAAASDGNHGFEPDDVACLLDHAPGEIVVLRPGQEKQLRPVPSWRRRIRAVSREYDRWTKAKSPGVLSHEDETA